MGYTMRGIATALGGLLVVFVGFLQFSCQQPPKTGPTPEDIQGIQIGTDAYVAYQHADCESVYQLTRPDALDAMQPTELRYSLRLVRGFCQELDGDQPAARVTYRRIVSEDSSSFAAADARERLRILDLLADDHEFEQRVKAAENGPRETVAPREPSTRSPASYPPLARASAVEGFAVIEFGISRQGKTIDPLVVDSEPPFVFDGTAVRTIRGWKYKAKRKADRNERHLIRIVFKTNVEPTTVDEIQGSTTPGSASAKPPVAPVPPAPSAPISH